MPLINRFADLGNSDLFLLLVEQMPAAVAMLDQNLCYLVVSRRWLTDYALENQDIIGRSHYDVFPLFHSAGETASGQKEERGKPDPSIHPHLLQRWQAIYTACLAGETHQGNSDYFIQPNGSRQWVKWEIQPWRTPTGEIGGVMIVTEFVSHYCFYQSTLLEAGDHCYPLTERASLKQVITQLEQEITERKQAQALQQESEERYRSLIAAMAEGIVLQDANGVIRTCNAAAERILGLSADQIMGRTSVDPRWQAVKASGEPFPGEEHPISITLKTGKAFHNFVMGIHKPDGTLTWLSVNSQPLFHPQQTQPYAAVASFIDITQSQQTEAKLRESEERFRATFEQAAVGINHTDVDGKLIRVNQKFCDILGYARTELLGLTSEELTHPADIESDRLAVQSLLAGKIETYSLEKRYLRRDETSVWVQITSSLVRTSQAEPKYFLNVVEDISSRKATEVALRYSQTRLREKVKREALLNQISTQIRNSLELNTILETTVQEIRQLLQIDRCHFAWYQPHEAQPYWEVVKEAREPDLPDLTGRYPADVVGLLAQQLLNLEILRIDDIETVTDPVFQQFVRSLGYTSVLLLPMQTPSGSIGVISCGHSRAARPWSNSEVELLQAVMSQLLIAIKQAELYAASRQATEQAQEQTTELAKTLTQLQRTQAQLIQTEKMSSLGQLVAGVAHEINNPVNFIYGNLIYAQEYCQDLLSLVQLYRKTYPNPPLMIRERIDAIDLDFMMGDLAKLQNSMKVGAERIREIVRSLRTFSRSDESGHKRVDIHSGLESTLMILQYRLKGKPGVPGITVIKEYTDLPLVECNPGQINQVFMNLLTNAIDALEEKLNAQSLEVKMEQRSATVYFSPTITIETGMIAGDCFPSRMNKSQGETCDNCHLFIRIADNGSGMTQQTQKQLFDPFFTTKPTGQGTGLGLAICYQIVVEKHGGRILCNSAPGQGAEFVVILPITYQGDKG